MGTLERSPGKSDNWLEAVGGLDPYLEKIAKAIHERQGKSISDAIQIAWGMIRKWAVAREGVSPDTVAKAAAAVANMERKRAQWRAKRSTDLSTPLDAGELAEVVDLAAADADPGADLDAAMVLDLAYGDRKPPYDWKHGYVPVSAQAARIRAGKEKSPNRGGSSSTAKATRVAGKMRPKASPTQRKAADDESRGRGVPSAPVDTDARRALGMTYDALEKAADGRDPKAAAVAQAELDRRAGAPRSPSSPVAPPSKARTDSLTAGITGRRDAAAATPPASPTAAIRDALPSDDNGFPTDADQARVRRMSKDQSLPQRTRSELATLESMMDGNELTNKEVKARLTRIEAASPPTARAPFAPSTTTDATLKSTSYPDLQDREAAARRAGDAALAARVKAERERRDVAQRAVNERIPAAPKSREQAARDRAASIDTSTAGRARSNAEAAAADRLAQARAIERKDYANAEGPALAKAAADRGLIGRERALQKSDAELRTMLRNADKESGSVITSDVAKRMSDEQLEKTLDRLAAAGDYSSPAFKAVEAEQNRRDDAKAKARSAEGNRPRR